MTVVLCHYTVVSVAHIAHKLVPDNIHIKTGIFILNSPDDQLLPSDRAALKQSEEMFSHMSCITGITIRLCDRSVLHSDAGERVLECLDKTDGPQRAASMICNQY